MVISKARFEQLKADKSLISCREEETAFEQMQAAEVRQERAKRSAATRKGKLYVVDFANRKLSTATCSLVGDNLHTGGAEYGVIIRDLCQCMVQAIDLDDTDGKFAIGAALHIALGSVLAS